LYTIGQFVYKKVGISMQKGKFPVKVVQDPD